MLSSRRPRLVVAASATALAAVGLTATTVVAAPRPGCTATVNQQVWPGGYLAGVTVSNSGSTLSPWSLSFRLPAGVTLNGTSCSAPGTVPAPVPTGITSTTAATSTTLGTMAPTSTTSSSTSSRTPTTTTSATLRDAATARGVYAGTATLVGEFANDPAYAALTKREFNMVTPGNEMKWDITEPSRGNFTFSSADKVVAFAKGNGQQVRGHALVWQTQLPSWVSNGGFSAAQLRTVMDDHITTEVTHFKGQVHAWDVVNEAFNEDGSFRSSVFYRTLGKDFVAEALRTAHAADPGAKLYLNDFNVEGINAKSDALFELVKSLKSAGVPIDGVGLQAHFVLGQVPSTLQQNIARFAALGVEVAITELDIRMTTPSDAGKLSQQADDYRKVATACFAVAGCRGITVWGSTDKYSWIPQHFSGSGAALLFDENLRPKPAYDALLAAYRG